MGTDGVRKKICFDWCAIETLYNKAKGQSFIIDRIKSNYSLALTSVNLNEASVIPDKNERYALFKFCSNLFSQNQSVLDEPSIILKKSYCAYKKKSSLLSPLMEKEVFDFLQNPQNYPENYLSEQKELYKKMKENYFRMNSEIKNDPRIKNKLNDLRISVNLSDFLITMFKLDDFNNEFFETIKKSLGIENNHETNGTNIIENLFPWTLYWSALLVGTFIQAIEQGSKKKAEITDLQQIIYFSVCDFFITSDSLFFKTLKYFLENIFFRVNTKVFLLDEFLKYDTF